jgi:hypothetical protein
MIFWKIRGRWHLDKLGAGNWELTPRQARCTGYGLELLPEEVGRM